MRTVALVTTVAMAMTSLWLAPGPARGQGVGRGPVIAPVDGVSWRDVLEGAVSASSTTPYEASMVVVVLDVEGPGVTEVQLRRGMDGDLSVSVSESWLIARADDDAMLRKEDASQLLHIGQVHALPFALAEVDRNYDVAVDGRADLATGSALAVTFHRDGVLRERLFVDDRTSLVVRRETYGGDGRPVRVTALSDLQVIEVAMDPVDDGGHDVLGARTRLAPDQIRQLSGHRWSVPTAVGGGFDLRAGFVLDQADAVHLLYSDGLYTISLLEQPGSVDAAALAGAVHEVRDDIPVYRWPGMQPLRVVWNGDGTTFTAVTDAPTDVLLDVVGDLPHGTAPSMPTRLGRGLARLGHWLWPFS